MTGRVHSWINLENHAVGADEIADPFCVAGPGCVAGAIEKTYLARRVAEEWEIEFELVGERAIILLGVETDAENLGVLLLVEPELVAEPATFGGSAGSVRFRIEPEDDVLAPVIGEADVVAPVVADHEVRCRRAFLEHLRESPLEAL